MSEYPELDRLLSLYLDGSATAAHIATLEATLAADEQFAEHFARWCLAHRQIADLHMESKLHDLMDQFATSSPSLPKEAFRERRERSGGGGGGKWLLASAVLAGALVSVAAWLIVDRSGRQIVDPSVAKTETEPAGTEPVVTATLTQIVDGVWAAGAPVLHHGQLLRVGDQVALASGMVKVTYDCGAEVVLEGPCDYWLHNRMEGYLASGRITANVPRRAFSFAILSPQVDLVDLGTSFGV